MINAKYKSMLDDLRNKYTVTVTDMYINFDGFPIRKGFLKLDDVNVASYEQDPDGDCYNDIIQLDIVLWTNFDNECRSMPDYVFPDGINVLQCDGELILAELFTGG